MQQKALGLQRLQYYLAQLLYVRRGECSFKERSSVLCTDLKIVVKVAKHKFIHSFVSYGLGLGLGKGNTAQDCKQQSIKRQKEAAWYA